MWKINQINIPVYFSWHVQLQDQQPTLRGNQKGNQSIRSQVLCLSILQLKSTDYAYTEMQKTTERVRNWKYASDVLRKWVTVQHFVSSKSKLSAPHPVPQNPHNRYQTTIQPLNYLTLKHCYSALQGIFPASGSSSMKGEKDRSLRLGRFAMVKVLGGLPLHLTGDESGG